MMSKKILLDLSKFRPAKDEKINFGKCVYDYHPNNTGMRDVVEKAMMAFTCRKCEDSPCIEICPEEALEKDEDGIVHRAHNLCLACESCVVACPFGTIMNDVFTLKRSICDLCNFDDNTDELECMKTAPEGAITFTDANEDENENIFKLTDKILVKEFVWDKLMKNV